MNEVRALVESFDEAMASGDKCSLATLVSVDGSSYRKPGARMLVRDGGLSTGTISAGCLESDVVEHAKEVIRTGTARLVEYDTASTSDEMAWGLGLGCNGVVRVLVEPLDRGSSFIKALRRSIDPQNGGDTAVAATVYEVCTPVAGPSISGMRLGTRLIFGEDSELLFENADADAASALASELRRRWASGFVSGATAVELDGTIVRVFVEELLPPVPLVIFGAGPDAGPIVELARGLGWRTEVVDPQARPATASRFAMADKVTLARPEEARDRVVITRRTMALLMTHNYAHDLSLLGLLLDSPAAYIGVMGPRRRTERMLQELGSSRGGRVTSGDDLSRLYSPVGLDTGANSPAEIAVSVVAEINAVLNGRNGGLLRERRGSIHGKPSDAEPIAFIEEPARPAASA